MNQQNWGFNTNMAQATQRNEEPPPQPSQSMNFFPPRQAHIVALKSAIATISKKKSNVSFIDPGVTYNFFHNRNLFEELEEIPTQTVNIAEELSKIFGKGRGKLSLGTVI